MIGGRSRKLGVISAVSAKLRGTTMRISKAAKRKPPEQLKMVVPPALREALDAAAAKSGLSVAEEIRQRVWRTFRQDAVDSHAAEFASKVAWLAEQITRDKGFNWYDHIKAFEAFAEAVNAALERRKPPEHTGLSAATDLMWGNDDPKTLGRAVERHYERFAVEHAKTERELKEMMKKRSGK
jgi:hypothetical protein